MSCQESEMSSYKGRRWPVWLKTLLALVLGMCLSGPVFAAAAGVAVLAAASHLLLLPL
mgnify:CR=1 FL=1